MNVIIVGCGKVGSAIAQNLAGEKTVNLTIIDQNQEALNKTADSIDAMLIRGSGVSAGTLTEAGAKDADLLISVTDSDEKNMLCGVTAKRLGVGRTIARVRDMEYTLEQGSFWSHMGLDMVVNPEYETAREISRLLRFPSADDIDIFAGGRVEMVSFRVSDAPDFFVGKTVAQIFYKQKTNILLAMVERGGEPYIPDGSLLFDNGDMIRVIGRPSDIMSFFTLIGIAKSRMKNIVVIGGGRICHYLLHLLKRHASNASVKVVDIDKSRCEMLSEQFPRCLILNADGSDEKFLDAEADEADAMVCLVDRDEENAVMALYAMRMGVRKVILKINYINKNMVKNLGLGSIVSPKNITADQVTHYVRAMSGAGGGDIQNVYRIYDGESGTVEATEFSVGADVKCINTALKDLRLKKGTLLGCIVRGSNIVIPTGATALQPGDRAVIITKNGALHKLDDILL